MNKRILYYTTKVNQFADSFPNKINKYRANRLRVYKNALYKRIEEIKS